MFHYQITKCWLSDITYLIALNKAEWNFTDSWYVMLLYQLNSRLNILLISIMLNFGGECINDKDSQTLILNILWYGEEQRGYVEIKGSILLFKIIVCHISFNFITPLVYYKLEQKHNVIFCMHVCLSFSVIFFCKLVLLSTRIRLCFYISNRTIFDGRW